MTRAEQALEAYRKKRMSWNEVLDEAGEIAEAYEQDYENETTMFEYPDGSVAQFCGISRDISAYGCK